MSPSIQRIVLCVVVGSTMLFPFISFAQVQSPTNAESTCSCWCSTEQGATSLGTKTIIQCKEECVKQKGSYLTCATDPSAWPINDLRCFTREQCTGKEVDGNYDGVWDTRPNPNCATDYRYCFPKSGNTEVELNIPIGNLTAVADLEPYLSKGFNWLIGIAVTVTIVMVMIGGLQYSIGAATPEQKAKGKKVILSGVTGLALLLSSVLLIQTVNPQLLKLNVPTLPMIKRVLLPQGISCGDYLLKKYQLSATSGKCGDVSDVLKDEKGTDLPVGTQCMWRGCSIGGQSCIFSGDGARCISCNLLTESLRDTTKITPSSGVCGQFTYPTTMVNNRPVTFQCGWTKDSDLNRGIAPKALRYGSCALYKIDCTRITKCEDYDTEIRPFNRNSRQPLEDIVYQDDVLCGMGGCGDFGLQTVCAENFCQIAGGCKYDDSAWLKYDCIPTGQN